MNRQEISQKGLELVSYSGEARSYFLIAIKKAKEKKFKEAEELVKQGQESLTEAHIAQTALLQNEAKGQYSDVTMIMLHGQDHLMTTLLLKDLIQTLIDVYKKKK